MTPALQGLLLFAHGARDPQWALPFQAVATRVASLSAGTPVVLAFLEFMEPTLAQAGSQLVAAGCTRVSVVPLFLGAGGHVRKDVPRLVEALRIQFPAVLWSVQPAVGETDAVVNAMASVAVAALQEA